MAIYKKGRLVNGMYQSGRAVLYAYEKGRLIFQLILGYIFTNDNFALFTDDGFAVKCNDQ